MNKFRFQIAKGFEDETALMHSGMRHLQAVFQDFFIPVSEEIQI